MNKFTISADIIRKIFHHFHIFFKFFANILTLHQHVEANEFVDRLIIIGFFLFLFFASQLPQQKKHENNERCVEREKDS